MRLLGLIAAGLVAGVVVVAFGGEGEAATDARAHTCSALDRKFIREAQVSLAALESSGREYLSGLGGSEDVIRDARRGEAAVRRARPTDPALGRTRVLLTSMFREYGRAIEARSRSRKAGPHILRAHSLANVARDVLSRAEPGLRAQGCDVSGLL